jgi:hypothetical protein
MSKFKQEILNKIKSDPALFCLVALEMGIKPVSLPIAIDANRKTLTSYRVVTKVAEYLNVNPEELLEEESKEMEPQETK